MSCKIKICGITNQPDRDFAAKAGADFCGVIVEVEQSPRHQSLAEAAALFENPPAPMVAVSLDRSLEEYIAFDRTLHPFALQLHGFETPDFVESLKPHVETEIWKAIHLPAIESGESIDRAAIEAQIDEYIQAGADRLLIDATVKTKAGTQMGGTGKTVDWNLAAELVRHSSVPVILAGGLRPGNVSQAVQTARPFAIDVSSGVEMTAGKKDPDRVLNLILEVKRLGSGLPGVV